MTINTSKKSEIIDITNNVQQEIDRKKLQKGVCVVFAMHTTCAITTADLDPGTDLDFLDALRAITPHLPYRHPHDPEHTPDHILSSIIGPSVTIPIQEGQLALGTWQRIVLVEFDGPRDREVTISLI